MSTCIEREESRRSPQAWVLWAPRANKFACGLSTRAALFAILCCACLGTGFPSANAQAEAKGDVLKLRNERGSEKRVPYELQWNAELGLIVGIYWEGDAKLELLVAAEGCESKKSEKTWDGAHYREVTFARNCPSSVTIVPRNGSGDPLGNVTLLCYPFDDGEDEKQGEDAAVSCFGDRQDLWTVANTSLVTVRRVEGSPFDVLLWKRGDDELAVAKQESYEFSPGPMAIEAGLTKAAVERAITKRPSIVKYKITGRVQPVSR